MNTDAGIMQALRELADEWDKDALADEANVTTSSFIGEAENARIEGQIQLSRMNAEALRDLVARFE